MDHLTFEQIVGYVTAVGVDDEARKEVARVNLHILKCEECLKRVRAIQILSEGIEAEYGRRQIRERLLEKTAEGQTLNKEGKRLDLKV